MRTPSSLIDQSSQTRSILTTRLPPGHLWEQCQLKALNFQTLMQYVAVGAGIFNLSIQSIKFCSITASDDHNRRILRTSWRTYCPLGCLPSRVAA